VKEEVSSSEGQGIPATKMIRNIVDGAVQRPILGLPEVRGCKYSRGLPCIFKGRPVDFLEIVITEEIGIRHT
jgi:hypothetical protein